MVKAIWVFLGYILVLVTSQSYRPEIYCSPYTYDFKKYDATWRAFKPRCFGGSRNYLYSWSELPYGWDNIAPQHLAGFSDYIFIPYNINPGRYQIKLTVYDSIYRIQQINYFILQFDNPDRPSVFSRKFPDLSIQSYPKTNPIQKQKTDFVFPSISDIQQFIEQGDIQGLRSIIQKTVTSNFQCSEKIQSLTSLISKIQEFDSRTSEIINKQNETLEDLNQQLSQKQEQLQKLKNSLTDKENIDVQKMLRAVQGRKNALEKRISQNEADRAGFLLGVEQIRNDVKVAQQTQMPRLQSQIVLLRYIADDLRKSILRNPFASKYKSYELNGVLNNLAERQQTLEKANQFIDSIEERVNQYIKNVEMIEKSIKQDVEMLKQVEEEIKILQGQAQNEIKSADLNVQIEKLSMQVQDLKVNIMKKEEQIKIVEKSKQNMKDGSQQFRISVGKQLRECELAELQKENQNNAIKTVNPTLNPISKAFDEEYGGQISGEKLKQYLESIVGINSYSSSPNQKYQINNINLYSPLWYQDMEKKNLYNSQQNYYQNLFTCNRLKSRPARFGKIIDFNTTKIWVQSENKLKYQLNFAPCSSLQTATGYLYPRKGDIILWNGSPNYLQPTIYNVKSAICL